MLYSLLFLLASANTEHEVQPLRSTSYRPLTTVAMAPARYQTPPQAPPLFTGTPDSIAADTKRLIEKSRGVIDSIVKNVPSEKATFNKTLLQMALDDNEMALEYHIIGFYQAVSTSKALRDASTEAEKEFEDFAIEASMREDVSGDSETISIQLLHCF